MRRRLLLLLPLLIALGLSACGSKRDTINSTHLTTVNVELDFFPNADHAALYAAIANGYFRQAGLNVVPHTPADPSEPLDLLAAGKVDMAISYEPELLLARNAGQQLVSIGALVNRPLTSIIATGNQHVHSIAQLKGKNVGTAGIPYQTAMLDTILDRAGVKSGAVKQTNVGFNLVPAMISGKVTATIGGYWNYEALQLSELGKHPTVIPVDRAGVPPYDELVLVVRAREAVDDGVTLRSFMQALSRGERAVQANPQQAVSAIMAANPSLSEKLQLASVKATLPATQASGKRPYGWQSPTAWHAFADWMQAHHLIRSAAGDVYAFDNEYLPGQGVPTTGVNNPDS